MASGQGIGPARGIAARGSRGIMDASRWKPMDDAPRDGTVLCLSDGREVVTSLWDGAGWLLFPEEWQRARLDPARFEPKRWMQVTFTANLPRLTPGGAR